jgi:hypothetical protein
MSLLLAEFRPPSVCAWRPGDVAGKMSGLLRFPVQACAGQRRVEMLVCGRLAEKNL